MWLKFDHKLTTVSDFNHGYLSIQKLNFQMQSAAVLSQVSQKTLCPEWIELKQN